jgi:dolichol-phosphate mannosyltransferase
MGPTVSVVLPVYNERETLDALVERLVPVLERTTGGAFEAVFVDDGSTDGSAERLDALHARDRRLKVLHFSRNFGHQAALQAGLDAATGDAVVLMDSDLQDPPEVVADLVAKWREGYEVVYAVRRVRQDRLLKRAIAAAFYRTLRVVADIDIPVDAGDFCLLDRRVVAALGALTERNRYLRGLRTWVGFRQIGVPYERDARYAGVPKYRFRSSLQLALVGYVAFSTVPLRLATWLGFLSALGGFAMALWAVAAKVLALRTVPGWASTLAVILFVGGVQLTMLGVVGEYLGRVYDEVRARPMYIVRARLGLDDAAAEPEQDAGRRRGRLGA